MQNRSAQLRDRANGLIERCEALDRLADGEQRMLSEAEQSEFDSNMAEVTRLWAAAERAASLEIGGQAPAPGDDGADGYEMRRLDAGSTAGQVRSRRGEGETRAFWHWVRTGDGTALRAEQRASNATDMNVGTPADGGYAVPTGLYQRIIAKRGETMVSGRLGVTRIPGQGTTVNVPVESGTANIFVTTAEGGAYDLDAPALGQTPMTLVKYTKRIQISEELLYDEDARLMDFVADYVGRALALTHNSALMVNLVGAGGATNVTLSGTGAGANAAHIPQIIGTLPDEYAEGAQFIMRRQTEYAYRALQGNAWLFENTPEGGSAGFWGFPIQRTSFAAAMALSAKAMHFGDFSQVGLRENPSMTVLRDPYSLAGTGFVNLWYMTRFTYKTLNAAAIIQGSLPAS